MKAKKLVLLLDVIVVAIITFAMMTGTVIKTTNLEQPQKLLAENSDLSFDLIASPEETRVKAGATVEITLSVKNIKIEEEGLNSVVGYLSYDEGLFEDVKIAAEQQAGWEMEINQIKDHDMYGKFCIFTMKEGVTKDQDVVKLTMKLKKDLKPQTTKVYFTKLASSNGEVEVPEEDRVVTIIIYEDNVPEPEPEKPEPEKPEPEKPTPVQTVDNKIIAIIAVAILTIILNVLTFGKNKKGKMLSTILVMVIGLSCAGIISYAAENNINVKDIINKLSYKQSWLNSEKYLVTEENVSRVAPGTKVETIKSQFNKEVIVTKDGKEIENGTILGTGMKISVKNPSKVDAEGDYAYELSVYADTNGDGKSNQVELTKIIRNIVDGEKWELTGVKFKSADLTVNNKIDREDVNASVKYIVYGEMEIPEFAPVAEPTIEVIEGEFDEEDNCYKTDVKVKITETAKNGIKTQYKVENSKGEIIPYTEISREKTEDEKYETVIELEKDEIYKISAYTTGELGNRSEIPYLIVNGIYNNIREYRVEYYYKNLANDEADIYEIDNEKTVIQYAELGSVISTYEDKNKLGYDLATEKGINGVEGLPLTINKNKDNNVIKVYYKIHHYGIEYDPNGGNWPNGENPNPSTYTIETPTITVENPARPGYEVVGWVNKNNQDEEPENPKTIPEGTTGEISIITKWRVIHYQITYKGLTEEEERTLNNPTSYTIEDEVNIQNPDNRLEANFEGWTGTGLEEKTMNVQIPRGSTGRREYTANWEEKIKYKVTGQVEGGNGKIQGKDGNIEAQKGLIAEVDPGATLNEIVLLPDEGYRADTAILYSGESTEGTTWRVNKRTNKVAKIQDINEDKHIVVTFTRRVDVAQIIGLPANNDERLNIDSEDGAKVLNHKYETLADAIHDAEIINEKRDDLGLYGEVKIIILTNIEEETNEIEEGNDVIINLDGFSITADNNEKSVITVKNGGSLQIIDENTAQSGKIENTNGTAITIQEGGILTIGENEEDSIANPPSTTCPTIKGTESVIKKEDNSKLKFYDGELVNEENGVILENNANIEDYPTGYIPTSDAGTRYILQIKQGQEARIGYDIYGTLEEAFDEVNNNPIYTIDNPATIVVIADDIVDVDNGTKLNANKKATLDINGRQITRTSSTNGSVIQASTNAELTITDSTGLPDLEKEYTELISDDENYKFEIINNYIQPNNYLNKGTTAKSHIEIDLTDKPSSERYTLEMNYASSIPYGYDGFKAYISTNSTRPTNISASDYLYNQSSSQNTSTKVLTGGRKYYLYLDYAAEEDSSQYVRINGLTINNEDLLKDVIIPKGKIYNGSGVLLLYRGKIIINNARIIQTSTNTNSTAITLNGSNGGDVLELNSGIIEGNIRCSDYMNRKIILNGGTVIGAIIDGNAYVWNNTNTLEINNNPFITKEISAGKIEMNNGIVKELGGRTMTIKDGVVLGQVVARGSSNTQEANSTTTEGGYIYRLNPAINTEIKNTTCEYLICCAHNSATTKINIEDSTVVKSITVTDTFKNTGNIQLNIKSGEIGEIKTTYNKGSSTNQENVTLNILGGKIKASGTAITTDDKTTINLGTKNEANNKNNPEIFGTTKGIDGACTLNFYDGVIISPAGQQLVNVNLSETEEIGGLALGTTTEAVTIEGVELEKLYLDSVDAPKVARVSAENVNVEGIDSSLYELNTEDNKYYFETIQAAVASCNSGTNSVVIEIVNTVENSQTITIPEEKNITIDLVGKNVSLNSARKIENNGKLTIIDSAETKGTLTGAIENYKELIINGVKHNGNIVNNSSLTITSGEITNVEGTENSETVITGGKITGALTSDGKITINEANDSSVIIDSLEANGTLDINGGTYGNVTIETEQEANITNATVTGMNKTLTITENTIANISNSNIKSIENKGTVNLSGTVNVEGIINRGTCTIPENCEYDGGSIYNLGTMQIGTKNGNVKYDKFKCSEISNGSTGTLKFYDGRVYGKITSSGIIEIEDRYILDEREEDGQTITDLQPAAYVYKVNENSIEDVTGIDCKHVNNDYYFYNIADAANAVNNNEATIEVTGNVTHYSDEETNEIPTGKNIILDLKGNTISFLHNNAIINKGTLTIKDTSTSKTGEIKTQDKFISNEGTLTIESGKYSLGSSLTSEAVITNTGSLTILEDASIDGFKAQSEPRSTIEIIKNINNGQAEINATNVNGNIINETDINNVNAGTTIKGEGQNTTIENNSGHVILEDYETEITIENKDRITIKGESDVYEISSINANQIIDNTEIIIESGTIGSSSGMSSISAQNIIIGTEESAITNAKPHVEGDINAEEIYIYCGEIITKPAYDTIENYKLCREQSNVTIPNNASLKVEIIDNEKYKTTLESRAEHEAQITNAQGTTQYTTLAQALEAAQDNDVVDLLADIVITDGRGAEINNNIALNLNGRTITMLDDNSTFVNNATLTITDTQGNGYITGTKNSGEAIVNKGTILFNNISIDGTHAFKIKNIDGGVTTVENGTQLEGAIISIGSQAEPSSGTINVDNATVGIIYAYGEDVTTTKVNITNNANVNIEDGNKVTVLLENSNNIGRVCIYDSNMPDYPVSKHNGIITAKNCKINTLAFDASEESLIENCEVTTFAIYGKITARNVDAQKVATGKGATLENCTINHTGAGAGLTVGGGKTTIIGGEYKSDDIAIKINKTRITIGSLTPELVLGINNNTAESTPYILGKNYGIYQESQYTTVQPGGLLYYYDGIIESENGVAIGTNSTDGYRIYEVPEAYTTKTTEDNKKITLELKGEYKGILKVGSIEYDLDNMDSAVTQAINTGSTIMVEKNIKLDKTWTIAEGHGTETEVTINLQGHTITANMENEIINNTVTLHITDSKGNAQIINEGGKAIDGTGQLNVDDGISIIDN